MPLFHHAAREGGLKKRAGHNKPYPDFLQLYRKDVSL